MREGVLEAGEDQELYIEAERPQEAAPGFLLPHTQPTSPPLLPIRQAGLPIVSGPAQTHSHLHIPAAVLPAALVYKLHPLQEPPSAVLYHQDLFL